MNQDEQNLNVLSIFHYVVGALTALFSCFPLVHVGLGITMVLNLFHDKDAPPPAVGWVMIALGSTVILCGWTLAILIIIAGRRLRARRSRTFCLIIAGLECFFMPFGTVLGVFTIIVLMKDSVFRMFEGVETPAIAEEANHSV